MWAFLFYTDLTFLRFFILHCFVTIKLQKIILRLEKDKKVKDKESIWERKGK